MEDCRYVLTGAPSPHLDRERMLKHNILAATALLATVLALGGCTCVAPVATACQSTADCPASSTCLPIQKCAPQCTSDAECTANEKCSASGGCVAKSGCGANTDCASGQECTAEGLCAQSCQGAGTCAAGSVCLNSGTCAVACTAGTSCAAGEKCSTIGACVPQSGCGAKEDCAANQLCDALGKCINDCRTAGCNAGAVCTTDGTCAAQAPDGGATSCGGELFQAAKVNSNMFIAFDKSGSMDNSITRNGPSKWEIATDAIKQVTQQYQSQIQFGLMLFPVGSGDSTKCVPGQVSVSVGDQRAAAIASTLNANMPGGATPIGAVLTSAGMVPELADPMRANYVMLVTDGAETCNGDGEAAATANLSTKGIKTFVVGFGGEVNAQNLTDIASAGGTARPGNVKYYQADDAPGLLAAFNLIAQGALGCEYRLATAPPDVTKVFVYVNGVLQTKDATHANGWDYSAQTQRITFYGGLCSLVAKDATAKVSIVYGCPDFSLVETDQRDGGAGLPNGATCTASGDCANGLCVGGVCGRADGQPCTTAADCASSLCGSGVCFSIN